MSESCASHSTLGSLAGSAQGDASPRTTVIEVYEYPADCVPTELLYHFCKQPYLAECITPLHAMWNYRSSSFVLEFAASDAVRIVQDPVQRLEEADPDSEIRLCLLDVRRCSQVLVTCQHELSHRMIRHFFGKFGKLESCQQSCGTGEYAVVLTYKDRSVAERVCQSATHRIGSALSVRAQLFADSLVKGELSSPAGTAFTLNFDLDSISCVDFEMNNQVQSMAMPQSVVRLSPIYDDCSTDHSYVSLEPLTAELEGKPVARLGQPTKQLSADTDGDSHHYETIDIKSVAQHSLKSSTINASKTSVASDANKTSVTSDANKTSVASDTSKTSVASDANKTSVASDTSKTSVASDAAETAVASESSTELSTRTMPSNPLPTLMYSVPTIRLHSCIQVNNCIIRLVYGDISQHIADVLVHSGGEAKQALARKWYVSPEPVKALEVLKVPTHGSIDVVTAPNLPASYVFGINFGNRPTALLEGKQQLVKLCLHHCCVLKARSIAFPAMGTGMYGQRANVMATALTSCIVDHMKQNSKSTLEIIDIVIYDNAILNDYALALKEATSSSRSSNFMCLLSKRRSKVENVYQVSNTSHKIQID